MAQLRRRWPRRPRGGGAPGAQAAAVRAGRRRRLPAGVPWAGARGRQPGVCRRLDQRHRPARLLPRQLAGGGRHGAPAGACRRTQRTRAHPSGALRRVMGPLLGSRGQQAMCPLLGVCRRSCAAAAAPLPPPQFQWSCLPGELVTGLHVSWETSPLAPATDLATGVRVYCENPNTCGGGPVPTPAGSPPPPPRPPPLSPPPSLKPPPSLNPPPPRPPPSSPPPTPKPPPPPPPRPPPLSPPPSLKPPPPASLSPPLARFAPPYAPRTGWSDWLGTETPQSTIGICPCGSHINVSASLRQAAAQLGGSRSCLLSPQPCQPCQHCVLPKPPSGLTPSAPPAVLRCSCGMCGLRRGCSPLPRTAGPSAA